MACWFSAGAVVVLASPGNRTGECPKHLRHLRHPKHLGHLRHPKHLRHLGGGTLVSRSKECASGMGKADGVHLPGFQT